MGSGSLSLLCPVLDSLLLSGNITFTVKCNMTPEDPVNPVGPSTVWCCPQVLMILSINTAWRLLKTKVTNKWGIFQCFPDKLWPYFNNVNHEPMPLPQSTFLESRWQRWLGPAMTSCCEWLCNDNYPLKEGHSSQGPDSYPCNSNVIIDQEGERCLNVVHKNVLLNLWHVWLKILFRLKLRPFTIYDSPVRVKIWFWSVFLSFAFHPSVFIFLPLFTQYTVWCRVLSVFWM